MQSESSDQFVGVCEQGFTEELMQQCGQITKGKTCSCHGYLSFRQYMTERYSGQFQVLKM